MSRATTLSLSVSLSVMLMTAAADANLITNGDFSGGGTGWTVTGTGTAISGGFAILGGGGDNRGAIYQTIATTAGQWYSVSYAKSHVGDGSNSGIMVTAFNGTGVAEANGYWGESYNGQDTAVVTRYFQAQGTSTTIQFRDFNYTGASHDPRFDNVVVDAVTNTSLNFSSNIARQATLTQSSFYNAGLYPASYGTDGVPNNFMHTNTANPEWYDLTFATPITVDRLVLTPREGFLARAGDTATFYDASNNVLGTTTLGNSSFIYVNDLIRQPVKRIRIQENSTNALNFAEVEVYAVRNLQPEGISLVDETFSSNNNLTNNRVALQWIENDGTPTTFEVYNSGGAGARNMASTYDHDNNIGTAQIAILGGIEINHEASNMTLTATIDLPSINIHLGFIEFWAGLRGNPAGNQTFDIYNVTDSRVILSPQIISLITSGATRNWTYNYFLIPFSNLDAGDQIVLRFFATGNGAEGLQLTDLNLVLNIPEPSSLALVGLAGLVALRRRARR